MFNNTAGDAINLWYNESLREGNSWDVYYGFDNDINGIGDVPYIFYSNYKGTYHDLSPLMDPYGGAVFDYPNENMDDNDILKTNEDNNTTDRTPGFELLLLITAIALLIIFKRCIDEG